MKPLDMVHQTWKDKGFMDLLQTNDMKNLNHNILKNCTYFPGKESTFKVFQMPLDRIKVVILGQDPYPSKGDATGHAFAVNMGTPLPVSLRNISTAIAKQIPNFLVSDYSYPHYDSPEWRTLHHWRKQGIFLLNTALTVESGNAGSHIQNWYGFTKSIIKMILQEQPCIWVLWGKKAQTIFWEVAKKTEDKVIIYEVNDDQDRILQSGYVDSHYILQSAHPAAEAYSGGKAGFFDNNHFNIINEILDKQGRDKILW